MAESMWTIPFGVHIRKDVEDVPDDYLIWLKGESWFKNKFPKELIIIEKELKYRNQFDLHIKGKYEKNN